MWRTWLVWAAVHGFLSVACGAFGAHGLRGKLSERMLENWETGARYEMYHALVLCVVAWMVTRQGGGAINAAGWCFALGTCIFSFSLYLLAYTGFTKLGMITPIGGLGMLAGWALLAYSALAAKSPTLTP